MEYVIETKGLEHSFGKVKALNGLELQIKEYSVFGLLGPNGAGKTTTIRILLNLVKPKKGKACILGIDL